MTSLLKIDYLSIDELQEYGKNAKLHPREQIEQIKKSIEEYGFDDPIAIDENNVIIDGHGRLIAAKELDLKTVPVIYLRHLTEEQKKAYRIAHNKINMNSGFDMQMLQAEINEILAADISFEAIGFDEDEIEEILQSADDIYNFDDISEHYEEDINNNKYNIEEDEFDHDEAISNIKEPRTQVGDIWILGKHRLICGDSTDEKVIKSLMRSKKADLLLTDPPYNVAYQGATKEKLTIENDDMSDEDFANFLTSAFTAADGNIKQGGAFYIWHADTEGLNFRKACKAIEWQVRECLIWVKNTLVLGRQDYHWKHEPCLYGWKSGKAHYFIDDRTQTTVLEYDKPARNAEHPTMKPIPLFAKLIENSTKEKEVVLDIFGGSGTTLIACEQLNRECRMVELSPLYCDVIVNRWEAFTGKKARKES